MIRKLRESDREELVAYLVREPAYNLFIIGDVENYGFDREFQELWGEFTSGGLNAVLLRYYSYLIISSKRADYDASGFAEIVKNWILKCFPVRKKPCTHLPKRSALPT